MVSVDELQALPSAIARAIRAMDLHPHVLGMEVAPRDKVDSPVAVTLQIKTELPTRWRGVSPHGVNEVEPVTLTFPISYPVNAPRPTLRDDFARWHPHLQPTAPELPPEPCLIFGSPRELIQTSGSILALLEQLVDWLDRAAMLKLNDPDHGWEFVRRDHMDDLVVGDRAAILDQVTRKSAGTWHRTWLIASLSKTDVYYRVSLKADEKVLANAKTLKTLGLNNRLKEDWTGLGLGLVVWPGKNPDGTEFVCDTYHPETVSTVQDLYGRAKLYGCGEVLATKLKWLRSQVITHQITNYFPVTVVLIARRPFNLIGQSLPLELCPYVIEFSDINDLIPTSQAAVRLAGHRDSISTDLLQRTSHGDVRAPWLSWTLLGCGSLGSKVAMHLARGGHAPSIAIDDDTMEPHNYARHSSIPFSADLDGMFYTPKANNLAHDISKFAQSTQSYIIDANTVLRSKELRNKLGVGTSDVIVNTTASAVLRETLSSTNWTEASPPRVIETSFMGDADIGYFALSGPQANPNSSDLMTEFYQHLRDDTDLRTKVMGQTASEIAIGQGCSSISMIASDTRLSSLAAPLATLVSDVLSGNVSEDHGVLRLGRLAPDGVSQSWTSTDVPPFTIAARKDARAVESRLARRVTIEIDAEITRKPGSETGGVLIGRYSTIANTFHVIDTLPAPPDSKFSAEEFVLGTEGLKDALAEISESSGNTLYALGTWHNHLRPSGPSTTDIHTAAKLAIGQIFPVLMIIRTPAGFQQLTAELIGLSKNTTSVQDPYFS